MSVPRALCGPSEGEEKVSPFSKTKSFLGEAAENRTFPESLTSKMY